MRRSALTSRIAVVALLTAAVLAGLLSAPSAATAEQPWRVRLSVGFDGPTTPQVLPLGKRYALSSEFRPIREPWGFTTSARLQKRTAGGWRTIRTQRADGWYEIWRMRGPSTPKTLRLRVVLPTSGGRARGVSPVLVLHFTDQRYAVTLDDRLAADGTYTDLSGVVRPVVGGYVVLQRRGFNDSWVREPVRRPNGEIIRAPIASDGTYRLRYQQAWGGGEFRVVKRFTLDPVRGTGSSRPFTVPNIIITIPA